MTICTNPVQDWKTYYGLPLLEGDCVTISNFQGLHRCLNKIDDLIFKYIATTGRRGNSDGVTRWRYDYENLRHQDCFFETYNLCVEDLDTYLNEYDDTVLSQKQNVVGIGIMERAWRSSIYLANYEIIDTPTYLQHGELDSIFETRNRDRYGGLDSESLKLISNPTKEQLGYVRYVINNSLVPTFSLSYDIFEKFLALKRDQEQAYDSGDRELPDDYVEDFISNLECGKNQVLKDLINTCWAMVEALRVNLAFAWFESADVSSDGGAFYDYFYGSNNPTPSGGSKKVFGARQGSSPRFITRPTFTESQEQNDEELEEFIDNFSTDSARFKPGFYNENVDMSSRIMVEVTKNNLGNYKHELSYSKSAHVMAPIRWFREVEDGFNPTVLGPEGDGVDHYTFVVPTVLPEKSQDSAYGTGPTTTTSYSDSYTEDSPPTPPESDNQANRYLNFFGLYENSDLHHIKYVQKQDSNDFRIRTVRVFPFDMCLASAPDGPDDCVTVYNEQQYQDYLDDGYVVRGNAPVPERSFWQWQDTRNYFLANLSNNTLKSIIKSNGPDGYYQTNAYRLQSNDRSGSTTNNVDVDEAVTDQIILEKLEDGTQVLGRFGFMLHFGALAKFCLVVPQSPVKNTCPPEGYVFDDDGNLQPGPDENPETEEDGDVPLDPDTDPEEGNGDIPSEEFD